jgi:WD40 repeat protein
MAPEQARGETVDARADVYAAGLVLAEMLTVGGEGAVSSRRALWKGVRETPPRVPEGPWAAVLRQALDPHPDARPPSARTLARALDEVTLRLPGFEEKRPYPGLASFTEEDAEYFFGREAEVEGLWKKLKRPRLLALIGPSGTGKSSFVRAGLLATLPPEWAAVVATPGHRPQQSLAQALVPAFFSDTEAMREFLRFEEADAAVSLVSRWRRRHEHALIVVDQFEELFTLSPPEVQAEYAELLGRLVLDADAHVLLSMRDDFLFHCHEYEALEPAFADLTPLGPLSESGLRRALVQPALACGYRFEDEALVEEMVDEVGRERGVLPLLAFAASRLWEKRDRERGLLTREAYQEIGGAAGALAQHAEATLERIGTHRAPLVRELFRNLVTAQGTRAMRERGELLSVFPEEHREDAEEVLAALVDARLLTSFEKEGDEAGGSRQEIEIIHESLLSRWPRLVRWQTQDADGAQLRDQLRQAAQAWEDRGRPEDLLWSGTAYRDFAVWKERYSGGLSTTEEAFASAAERRAGRRRRRRRWAAAAAVTVAAVVATTTSVLWHQADVQARRAEAARFVALGRVELDRYPTATLAYIRKSLELADSIEARLLAVEALWRGPAARILPVDRIAEELGTAEDRDLIDRVVFSPDGRWVATQEQRSRAVHLFPREGGPARALPPRSESKANLLGFSPRGDRLVAGGPGHTVRLWSMPDLRPLDTRPLDGKFTWGAVRGETLLTFTEVPEGEGAVQVRSWPFLGGDLELIGRWEGPWSAMDATGRRLALGRGRNVTMAELGLHSSRTVRERILGEHPQLIRDLSFVGTGERLASVDREGEIRVWSTAENAPAPLRILEERISAGSRFYGPDPRSSRLAAGGKDSSVILWDLDRSPLVAPAILQRPDMLSLYSGAFDPTGRWLATGNGTDLAFWPLVGPSVEVLRGPIDGIFSMAFTPDGRWFVPCSNKHPLSLWPLGDDEEVRTLLPGEPCWSVSPHPAGTHVVVGTTGRRIVVAPTAGGPASVLLEGGFEGQSGVAAFGDRGRRVVATRMSFRSTDTPADPVLHVWDLETGDERTFSIAHLVDTPWVGHYYLRVAPDGSVFAGGRGGVWRFTLPTNPDGRVTGEAVYRVGAGSAAFDLSRDGHVMVAWGTRRAGNSPYDELHVFDLAEGISRRITTHGNAFCAAVDPSGRILVSGGTDGLVRVGPVSGGEPHLLFGHTGPVITMAVSPDGRWIASASHDSVRLWPMPDVAKPPFHSLPHAELMAKLRGLTNLEVVADATSPTGYDVEPGPFPGWAEVPEW